jgi:predicted dithiol-disulfide oxidoreductase (DUF899 family)
MPPATKNRRLPNQRGIDLLTPVYNVLDLTPGGRGDWYADLEYL